MTMQSSKSSADVEREVEWNRAEVAGTLDQLKNRMTPGQLTDEVWAIARDGGGGDFVRNLGTSIRDNPLPVALIGAGLAWLMSGRSGGLPRVSWSDRDGDARSYSQTRRSIGETAAFGSDEFHPSYNSSLYGESESDEPGLADKARQYGQQARDAVSGAAGSVSDATSRAAGSVSDTASRAAGAVGNAASGVASSVASAASSAASTASDAAAYVGDRASSFGRSASQRTREFGGQAWRAGQGAQKRAVGYAEEQPLLLAIAGLAIGAAIGAAVRSTALEAEYLGETSDRLKDQAKTLAKQGLDDAKSAAGRTLDLVKEEAAHEGLTLADAKDVGGSLTDKVKKVAQKGKAKLKEELDTATGGTGSESGNAEQNS